MRYLLLRYTVCLLRGHQQSQPWAFVTLEGGRTLGKAGCYRCRASLWVEAVL